MNLIQYMIKVIDEDGHVVHMGNGILAQMEQHPIIASGYTVQKTYELAQQILNDTIWTIETNSTSDTYSGSLNQSFESKTYQQLKKDIEERDQKEKEAQERIDNIMNKYGLV